MSHSKEANQVTNSNLTTVYRYHYYVTDGSGRCDKCNFTVEKNDVALSNDKFVVLDDSKFTRIALDSKSSNGSSVIDEAFMSISSDCQIFGNGFTFTLASSVELTAFDLQEMIVSEYGRKLGLLVNVSIPEIDDALIADAISISRQVA